jgi:hypothetical protein
MAVVALIDGDASWPERPQAAKKVVQDFAPDAGRTCSCCWHGPVHCEAQRQSLTCRSSNPWAFERCRVGRGGAYALPLPARSNGSCSFPASRFPVWAPLRRRRRIDVLQCQSTPPGYPRCRRRVFRKANLSALPSCTCPFLVIRLCHTVRGLPPPHGLLGPSGVVIPR